MKILVFSNYFPPEMGAASNRIYAMAKGLLDLGHEVEVICPLPNYPKGKIFDKYRGKFKVVEEQKSIKTRRYWIYASVSKNPLLRMIAMVSFAVSFWADFFYFKKRKPDVVIIQNSPLFVSLSATIMAKFFPGCKRVLNVSDLWPLSAFELGVMKKGVFYNLLEKIENYNYRNSDLIMGQSEEILTHVGERVKKELFLYRNISPDYSVENISYQKDGNGEFRIIYAGLLGVAQGIFELIKNIDFKSLNVEFHIYGNGNEESKIIEYLANNSDSNVFFHGSIPIQQLHKILPGFHASIVPLATRIYGAVPSKIYELTSFGVPILFCGGGEGAEIVDKNKVGFISDPGDFEKLTQNIFQLKNLNTTDYNKIIDNCRFMTTEILNFEKQLNELNAVLLTLK